MNVDIQMSRIWNALCAENHQEAEFLGNRLWRHLHTASPMPRGLSRLQVAVWLQGVGL